MQIDPSRLERWLAEVGPDADVSLTGGGVRPLASDRFDTDPGAFDDTPTADGPELGAEIGERHGREGSETVVTRGSREATLLATLALLEDHAVVVTPAAGSLPALADAFGDTTRVPLRGPGSTLDPEAVGEALGPATDFVAVGNPNDPTGRIHDGATMRAVYERCADNGTYLLCDESYRPFSPDPPPSVAGLGRYGISTGGVSKAFGLGGLRVGWLCGPPAVVAAAGNWRAYTTASPSVLDRHVVAQALDRRAELLPENRAHVANNRASVEAFVGSRELEWSSPDCGPSALCSIPDGFANGESFCRSLLAEASVAAVPGGVYGRPDRFRLGFGGETAALEEGLSRLGRFLDRHR